MTPKEAINHLNDIYKRFTTVPTKRIRKLTKVIVDENYMLRKDNAQLRKKIKKVRGGNMQ